MPVIQKQLIDYANALTRRGIHNATQELGWILSYVLGEHPVRYLPGREPDLAPSQLASFVELAERRLAGEPLQYVLESTDFYGLELEVQPGVLVPRPETERLVDFALELYPGHGDICDLCTGSGAIALALAHEINTPCSIVGIDISENALDIARRNAVYHNADRVSFVAGDLFAPVADGTRFSLITANPPYISQTAYDNLPDEVRCWEPRCALWADDDGLGIIRRIAEEARSYAADKAWLLCEIGDEQGAAAKTLFRKMGWQHIEIRKDYTGRDRVLIAQAPERIEKETHCQ